MKIPLPAIISFFFLIAFVTPVAYLIVGSTFFQIGTRESFIGIFSANTGFLLSNTLIFSVSGALIGTLLGYVYAWVIIRTDVPWKTLLRILTVLPLTMPFLVKSLAWILLLSPNVGLINQLYRALSGSTTPIFNIYSMWGMIFAYAAGSVPFAYLTIEPAVRSLDPALEEASRIAGKGLLKTFSRISFPVLLPAIFSAFLMNFIGGLENFEYPFMLGTPVNIKTLATEVYFQVFQHIPPNYQRAAYLSIIYLIASFAIVTIYLWSTRRANKFVVVTGKGAQKTVHRLGKWKYAAFAVCFSVSFVSFILPFSMVVLMSFVSFITIGPTGIVLKFTLDNYADGLNLPMFWSSLTNSVILGIASGIIATLLATFMCYAALKSRTKGARLIEYVSAIPLAFPGIVYGLAIFWTFLMFPGISGLIYGTIWPLVVAVVVLRLPTAVRMVSGNLMQISGELEEASRISGASWLRTFRKIVLPLLKGGLANSILYIFINSIRELGVVVMLVTPQSIVLMMLLLNLYSQHSMAVNTISAISVLFSLSILALLAITSLVQYRYSRLGTTPRLGKNEQNEQKVLQQDGSPPEFR